MSKGNWFHKGMLAGAALLLASAVASRPAAAADEGELPAVIAKTTPSVVAIIGKPSGTGDDEWESDRFNLGHGTGVIMDRNGVIITNAHVVKDMKNLVVVTADGKSYPGKATNIDEESDLALVKIEASNLPTATLAAAGDIEVGETVAAIGTPISFALRNSVTVGIVSGLDRSLSSRYQLIQTDAAINPGNSGGALVNMEGEVVGINTMKFTSYGVENLGFAIPMDTVRYVLDHFQKYGKVKRPYLGVELEESWEAVVGLPSQDGLRVAYVEPESPAAKAGFAEGDQLLKIGDAAVNTLVGYHEALKKYLPGDSLSVKVKTESGQQTERSVTLGEDTSVQKPVAEGGDDSGIDADQGKTLIGDSYYGWSMKYPAGLVKESQSDDGDEVDFEDAKGEFSLNIQVKDMSGSELSIAGLFGKMSAAGTTVLEKKYVKPESGLPYAKLVAKSFRDSYTQSRAYQKDGKVYIVSLYVGDEETYTNKFKLNSYDDLLDSFKLSFDKSNAALKDISVHKTTGSKVTNEYGLSLQLPADWDDEGSRFNRNFFMSDDYEQYVSFEVSSASSGETLDAWLKRKLQLFNDQYAAAFRSAGEAQDVTIAGAPAKRIETSSTMGSEWNSTTTLLILKDKYKYEISIGYPKDSQGREAFVKGIIDSIQIDKSAMNPALGFIQDVEELLDPNKTVRYQSEKYKYALTVPETWEDLENSYSDEKDPARIGYYFTGGGFALEADANGKAETKLKDLETAHRKNANDDAEYKYTVSDENVFGVAAKKIELVYNNSEAPYRQTQYVFEKNHIVYTVTLRMNDAVRTEANEKRLSDVLASLQFTE
ncbi:trypsin-like peptidase domain-containing protein [Paenibacillus chartarius]|uniref:Trypsin-like peptidase domain-containing protein n=1 Tax=Paenibacillus chartarius TaxID=747481 RepID=A0ABV6DF78_9BACL